MWSKRLYIGILQGVIEGYIKGQKGNQREKKVFKAEIKKKCAKACQILQLIYCNKISFLASETFTRWNVV